LTNNVKTIEQLIKELSEQEKVALDGFITDCLTRAEEIKKRREDFQEFQKNLGLKQALISLGDTLSRKGIINAD